MKQQLIFDFEVNKKDNTVHVKREFAADLKTVWEAWTTPEILDQWWAPKPYKTVTISMDFSEGGRWLYYMLSPEGDKHYCLNDYHKIDLHKSYSGLDAFCNEEGEISTEMPRTLWTNSFNEQNGNTIVTIVARYDSLEDLEKVIALGFKEGFTMALENLDQVLREI